jgi:hypothetical protein
MKSKKPLNKKKFIIISAICLPILLVMAYFLYTYVIFERPFDRNYAKELDAPIDKSLKEAGAVLVCDDSASGKGLTNGTPGYSARYQLNVDKDQAVEIIKKAALDNGYELKQGDSGYYKTILYFSSSKPSTYTDLVDGKIALGMSLYTDSAEKELDCENNGKPVRLESDATHTALNFDIGLPRYKDR